MSDNIGTEDYDLNRIIVRPLYFSMVANITVPMILLFGCYMINNRFGGVRDKLGSASDMVLYVLAALALAEAVYAIWWRGKLFAAPMIRSKETFQEDFSNEYLRRCRPLFLLIASTSIYGYLFYFLTGRFNESVMFVVFSFLVFQAVRPRYGLVRKLIERQRALVDKGQFLV